MLSMDASLHSAKSNESMMERNFFYKNSWPWSMGSSCALRRKSEWWQLILLPKSGDEEIGYENVDKINYEFVN